MGVGVEEEEAACREKSLRFLENTKRQGFEKGEFGE